jgi:predicted enzyme related to lactoylglutathione lyase
MKRVQGIGGLFFKAQDPQALQSWYDAHLGISPLPHSPWGASDLASLFEWRDKDDSGRICYSVFGVFPADTDYFEPGTQPFMFNFRVDDLDGLLAQLLDAGVHPVGEVLTLSFGRFARIVDPEGNPIELWEPAEGF